MKKKTEKTTEKSADGLVSLTIRVGDTTYELTETEALKLRDTLNNIYGDGFVRTTWPQVTWDDATTDPYRITWRGTSWTTT